MLDVTGIRVTQSAVSSLVILVPAESSLPESERETLGEARAAGSRSDQRWMESSAPKGRERTMAQTKGPSASKGAI